MDGENQTHWKRRTYKWLNGPLGEHIYHWQFIASLMFLTDTFPITEVENF